MEETEMEKILDELQHIKQNPLDFEQEDEVFWKMHTLAESNYGPAQDFFVACLDNLDANWRYAGLRCLGFHYDFSPDNPITEKIRYLLLNDPSPDVRTAAALVLGGHSQWPDSTLRTALESDPDRHVRLSALESLLELAGVPRMTIQEKIKQAENNATQVTWERFKEVVQSSGINLL